MNAHAKMASTPGGSVSYQQDFHAWLRAQANALRGHEAALLDWENLAEEIESLGISDEREMLSRLRVIIEHLLKYEFGAIRQPEAGWLETIRTQRDDLEDLLRLSPSLRRKAAENLDRVYARGRREAVAKLGAHEPERAAEYARELPEAALYSIEQIMDADFLPVPRR